MTGELGGPPSLSPDGKYVAWLSSGATATSLVLCDAGTGVELDRVSSGPARARGFTWSRTPGIGIAPADPTGAEQPLMYRFSADEREWTPLVETAGVQLAGLSSRRPEEVLVSAGHYETVCLRTGRRTTVLEDTGFSAVYFDSAFRPRLTETVNEDGSRDLWHDGRLFLHVPHEHALDVRFSHFSATGAVAYFVLPDGGDGTRLAGLRCTDGEPASVEETLLSVRRAGINQVHAAPDTGRPDFAEVERFRRRTVALRPGLARDLGALRRQVGGEPLLIDRCGRDRWLCAERPADAAARYFVHDPAAGTVVRLGGTPRTPAVSCRPVSVPLRDGLRAVTYLAKAGDLGPAPAALLVHGGPWRRSHWEYDERRMWLARLGYTVIDINFRGSTGFGPAWVNAGDRQWGAAMQEDLEDALDWSVRRGHADPERIALVGGSYGGYAVLQLAASSSRPFRCAVASAALTDLVRFTEAPPERWRTAAPMVRRRVGDPRDDEQRAALVARSPVANADKIACPVLLVHGAHDSRVPADLSTTMFMRLARTGRAAVLALFPDEGHEIVGAANRRAVDGLTAAFLARHVLDTGVVAAPAGPSSMRLLRTPAYLDLPTGLEGALPC
ncbi:alpha/beta fold hydrolase [Amycolatopsis sp. YIM 10]|uniref:S9 family peptidase n=1 Tax=Amycolatopsis sp. YIM 10 TaxID=2653857 RepID=UPI00128FEADF|nr:alpha/beta fold hydrolase [Amycolatopsis sp. YIM 10]QFU91064.1 Prolyl tripeptidyl peptidase precursor [Amycolatopsis sp. YIM 10]